MFGSIFNASDVSKKLLKYRTTKTIATKAEVGIFFELNLFAWSILLKKKLEIEKTKPTISYQFLKVEYFSKLEILFAQEEIQYFKEVIEYHIDKDSHQLELFQ